MIDPPSVENATKSQGGYEFLSLHSHFVRTIVIQSESSVRGPSESPFPFLRCHDLTNHNAIIMRNVYLPSLHLYDNFIKQTAAKVLL